MQYPSIIRAVEADDLILVQVMLEHYDDLVEDINFIEEVERKGISIYTSPLMRTNYISNKLEITNLLLEYGANPRAQIDYFNRIYDVSDKVPHAIALESEIVSKIMDSMIQRISSQIPEPNSLVNYSPISELDSLSNPVIFSLFLAKEIIETSNNINYFAKNILYLPKIKLPEIVNNEVFLTGVHYTICHMATQAFGIKLTLNQIIYQALDSSTYGLNSYLVKNNLVGLSLFSDNIMVGNLIYYINLYNLEKPNQGFSFVGAIISGSVNTAILYCSIANKQYYRNSNLRETMALTKSFLVFIKQATLLDYGIKSAVKIIENEIISPLADYFLGENSLDVLD